MTNHPKDIKLKEQDAIREIMGHPPGCLLRWGISVVLIGVLVLLLIAWLVKYPDVIEARSLIMTDNPPIRIVSKQDGKLQELFVENNKVVAKGDVLAIMESTTDFADVQKVSQYLDELSGNRFSQRKQPTSLKLGVLQVAWSGFSQKLKNYQYFLQNDITSQKIQNLQQQIGHFEELNSSLRQQQNTLQEALNLSQKAKERIQKLSDLGSSSAVEVENATARYLEAKRQKEVHSSQIINNKIEMERLRAMIMDLQGNKGTALSEKEIKIQGDIQRLQTEINEWKQNYLLLAAIEGKVNMIKFWSAKQHINAGTEVMTIIPLDTSSHHQIIAKALLPVARSGKVEPQMEVNLRLDAYPYQEFGVLKGQIQSIAPIAEAGQIQVEINIPQDLTTTYNNKIAFQQEMQATARIITKDKRLLDRLFEKVTSVLENN